VTLRLGPHANPLSPGGLHNTGNVEVYGLRLDLPIAEDEHTCAAEDGGERKLGRILTSVIAAAPWQPVALPVRQTSANHASSCVHEDLVCHANSLLAFLQTGPHRCTKR